MSRYYFICNPASKSGHGIEIWKQIETYLKENKIDYDVMFSKKIGHITELVYKLTSAHTNSSEPVNVIILGGDGSLDEALQGIASFKKTNLGYIPTGSGNDFARALAYSDDPIESLKNILSVSEARIVDLGKLEYYNTTADRSIPEITEIPSTHYFDVSCGIGFDAAICAEILHSRAKEFLNKIGLGKLVYVLVALKLIFSDRQPDISLTLDDDEELKLKKLRFVVGMNTCYEGGGFKFAPNAVPDDGFLDICTVNNISALHALSIIPKATKGKHIKSKKVHLYHVKSFEVKSDTPMWVHTDGEVFTKSSHIRVSVEPAKLRLLM